MPPLRRFVPSGLVALVVLASPTGLVCAQQEDLKNRPTVARSAQSGGRRVIPSGTPPRAAEREPQRTPPVRPGQTGTPDGVQAAREFFNLTEIPAFYDRQVQTILQQQLRDNPELRPYSDILRNFFEQHASWRAISEDLAVFLADSFEERELRQLNAFAATSAGRKLFNNLEFFARGDFTAEKLRRIFDDVELKQIEVFSRTAVFQKFTQRIPTVFEAGTRIVTERIERHTDELAEAIQRRRQQRRP